MYFVIIFEVKIYENILFYQLKILLINYKLNYYIMI